MTMELIVLKRPLNSPDPSVIEQPLTVVEQEIRMCSQEICSKCKMLSCHCGPESEESIQHLIETAMKNYSTAEGKRGSVLISSCFLYSLLALRSCSQTPIFNIKQSMPVLRIHFSLLTAD